MTEFGRCKDINVRIYPLCHGDDICGLLSAVCDMFLTILKLKVKLFLMRNVSFVGILSAKLL